MKLMKHFELNADISNPPPPPAVHLECFGRDLCFWNSQRFQICFVLHKQNYFGTCTLQSFRLTGLDDGVLGCFENRRAVQNKGFAAGQRFRLASKKNKRFNWSLVLIYTEKQIIVEYTNLRWNIHLFVINYKMVLHCCHMYTIFQALKLLSAVK